MAVSDNFLGWLFGFGLLYYFMCLSKKQSKRMLGWLGFVIMGAMGGYVFREDVMGFIIGMIAIMIGGTMLIQEFSNDGEKPRGWIYT